MKILQKLSLGIMALLAFIPGFASATTTITLPGYSATFNGPLGLLVDLGFQNVPGVTTAWARLLYNWIAFGLVAWIAFAADERSSTTFCVIATGIAAMTAWFGWFTVPNNPYGAWGLIALCALLSVAMYMTEKKRVNWGVSGGGDALLNIVLIIVIFTATIGLINGSGIFNAGQQVTPPGVCPAGQYLGCTLSGNTLITGIQAQNNTILGQFLDLVFGMAMIGWNLFLLIVQMLVSVVFFAPMLVLVFPWLASSPPALLLLGLMQIGIWYIYSLALMRYVFKPMMGDGKI